MEIKGKRGNIEKHSLPDSFPDTKHLEELGLGEVGAMAGSWALGS
jgi:hypothetical protein